MSTTLPGLLLALVFLFLTWLPVRRMLLEPRLRRKRAEHSLLQAFVMQHAPRQ